jgi:signal transduction histidine kinase
MKYDELARCLSDASDLIMQRWREAARRDADQPACRHGLEGKELDDHLPSLLRMLARCLREEATPEVEREGAAHGKQRRRLGYTIGELFDEMMLFKRTTVEVLEECAAERSNFTFAHLSQARFRLVDLIDLSLKASVEQFVSETEAERRAARVELERKNTELDKANEHKDVFLAVLSHELRGPLSAIFTANQVTSLLVDDQKVQRQVGIIDRQARHATKLVDDLLDMSRIARGKVGIEPKVFDLAAAARVAAETCRGELDAKGLTFELRAAELLPIEADETRITQVVVNLIGNACKFTDAGGSVVVSVKREADDAVLRVRDSGIGISAELQTRIFDPFQQGDGEGRKWGLGIGLALAKGLVEMQRGSIEARSDGPGEGTEMVVRLPLAATA